MASNPSEVLSNASLSSTTPDRIGLNPNPDEKDLEGVSLLRRIFPNESIETLRKLHEERLLRAAAGKSKGVNSHPPSSSAHILSNSNQNKRLRPHGNQVRLPDDFLRLPNATAVRRYNEQFQKWEYQLVEHLHERALSQHQRNNRGAISSDSFYTMVLVRHPEFGLGITLTESMGFVRIFGFAGGQSNASKSTMNIGDIVVGINGYTLLEIALNKQSLLRQAVAHLKSSPSPVVLHLQKMPLRLDKKPSLPPPSTLSLLDTTLDESFQSETSFELSRAQLEPEIHPLALVLLSRGLVKSAADQAYVTTALQQFAARTRQWELSNSFRIDGEKHHLLTPVSGPEAAFTTPARRRQPDTTVPSSVYARTTPDSITDEASIGSFSYSSTVSRSSYPSLRARTPSHLYETPSHIFIPLMGVRKALSIRILNSFLDGEYVAYTIWVCDIESGREWYAPLRYFRDFQDLRAATRSLRPEIAGIHFPIQGWFSFGSSEASESEATREAKCQQLEHFLRTLCTMIYTEPLHPAVAEVAVHIQSFLGCDNVLQYNSHDLCHRALSPINFMRDGASQSEEQLRKRTLLKRALQMYAFRIFLLDPMLKLVAQFVDNARANGPSLNDIEKMQAKSRNALKKRALKELEKIQAVVDQLQELILEGCMEDLRAIAQSETFDSIHAFISGESGVEAYWDRLVREAVRGQVEIEVYLPLRGTVSRLLVNAWRHEDMAVSFKVQVYLQVFN